MKNRIVIGLIIALLFPLKPVAQNWEVEWEKQFKQTNTEIFTDVLEIADQNLVVLGAVVPGEKTDQDVWLLRIDAQGNQVWEKTYGTNRNDFATQLAAMPGGGYIIVGESDLEDNGCEAYILRVDDEGNEIWQKSIAKGDCNRLNDVITLQDETIIVSGSVTENSESKIYLAKFADDGELIWEKEFEDQGNASAVSIRALPDGDFIIAGNYCNEDDTESGLCLLRLNEAGEEIWDEKIKPEDIDVQPKCVCVSPEGNLVVAGWAGTKMDFGDAEITIFDYDLFIAEVNQEGKLLWTKNIDSEGNEGGNAVAVRPDGTILLAGKKETSFMGRIGPWLLLMDNNGDVVSEQVLPFLFAENQASKIICSASGGCVVIGPGEANNENYKTVAWIQKYKPF